MPLGGFISETIYEGRLRSSHNIVDHSCIVFIDVGKGKETWQGKSYKVSIAAREPLLERVTFARTEHRGDPYGGPGR